MTSHNIVDWSHGMTRSLLQPLTKVRGAGRLCSAVNRLHLALSATPVKPARMRDNTSILVDLRSRTEWYSWYTGRYDELPLRVCRELLKALGGNFLDVGGNIGMYAIRVAHMLPDDCKVYVAEPVPANQQRIIENAALNAVSEKIHLLPIALSDTAGQVTITLREDFELGSSTGNASIAISEEADAGFKTISAPTDRYDEVRLSQGISDVHVVKVDIEGHEDLFFDGAHQWISDAKPIILTEVNSWYYEKRNTTIRDAFRRTLPDDYLAWRIRDRRPRVEFSPIEDLNKICGLENILMATRQRLARVCEGNAAFSIA